LPCQPSPLPGWCGPTPSWGYDYVLDVYDDNTGWISNYFTVNGVGDQAYGASSPITFADDLEITRLRFRDGWFFSVGMDGLTISTAPDLVKVVTAPIPATAWLLGAGLFGLLGVRRQGRKQ
jgi:hypothetical protein